MKLEIFFSFLVTVFTVDGSSPSPELRATILQIQITPVTWLPINSNCGVPILASATGSKIPTGTYTIKLLKHIVYSLGLLDEGLIFQNEILPL